MLKFLQNIIGDVATWLGAFLLGFFVIVFSIIRFILEFRIPITLLIIAIAFCVFVPVIGIPVAIFCGLFAIWLMIVIIRGMIYVKNKKKIVMRILKDRPELLNDKEACIKTLYDEVGDMSPEDLRDKDQEKNKVKSMKIISSMVDEYVKKNKQISIECCNFLCSGFTARAVFVHDSSERQFAR